MRNRIENAVVRINIDIDYSSLNDEEIVHLHKLIALGDWQLNAPCNNRLTRIDELRHEIKSLEAGETDNRNEITNKIRDLRISINNDKEQGHFRDYGILKLRIAQGATATEVYSMMPYFYAEAYNLNLQFSSRNKNNNEGRSSSILEGGTKWLNFLKSLSDFFQTVGGSA